MSSSAAASHASCARDPSSSAASCRPSADPRRDPLPISLTRPARANPSSTSLVPCTAEGRPIPVDDSTAEHRTSALREINNHYPSRHRYAGSSGAKSSAYSVPVIVRSYYPPVPSRPVNPARSGGVVGGGSGSASGSDAGGPGARGLPFATKAALGGDGVLGTMAQGRVSKVPGAQAQQEARLPPVEAFSFKSFMANMEAQSCGSDINADLDRIAEICARSRYSLSNQYEVHYAPHGSGASFLAKTQQKQDAQGRPTLQSVSSDDEGNMRRQKRRRHPGRRNSRAMGTLETIMSSSRSSDEDNDKKKLAAEMADRVRGRAARKEPGRSSPANASSRSDDEAPFKAHTRRPSTSLAFIDGSRQSPTSGDSAAGLVSEPALPQASTSHLELRTAPEQTPEARNGGKNKTAPAPPSNERDPAVAKGSISPMRDGGSATGLLATLGSWIPWGSPGKQEGLAEGSLRDLLKATDYRAKSAAKAGV